MVFPSVLSASSNFTRMPSTVSHARTRKEFAQCVGSRFLTQLHTSRATCSCSLRAPCALQPAGRDWISSECTEDGVCIGDFGSCKTEMFLLEGKTYAVDWSKPLHAVVSVIPASSDILGRHPFSYAVTTGSAAKPG